MDKVIGFEVPVDNLKRAQKFLKVVFGWKFMEGGYSHITSVAMDKNWVPKEKGAVNGGMYKRETKKDKPEIVVTVDSIEASLAKAKKAAARS